MDVFDLTTRGAPPTWWTRRGFKWGRLRARVLAKTLPQPPQLPLHNAHSGAPSEISSILTSGWRLSFPTALNPSLATHSNPGALPADHHTADARETNTNYIKPYKITLCKGSSSLLSYGMAFKNYAPDMTRTAEAWTLAQAMNRHTVTCPSITGIPFTDLAR
jgi:hypothetical protein